MMFNGMDVVVSPLAIEKTKEPARPYKRRRWQTDAQFARRQKKWLKRYGVVMKPTAYILLGQTIVVHPELYLKLKQAIEKETEKVATRYAYSSSHRFAFQGGPGVVTVGMVP